MLILATLLMSATLARGQGNDFPDFTPGVPAWDQPPSILPPLGVGGNTAGYAFGPLWVNNKAGDTIRVEYKLRVLGLPVVSSIISDGAASMTFPAGQDTPAEQWRGWCLHCEWDVVAAQDNIGLWLTFQGSPNFAADLQIIDVIPTPRHVLSKAEKDAAHAKAAQMANWATVIATTALPLTCRGGIWIEACIGTLAMFWAFTLQSQHLAAVDPWDALYFVPYDPSFPSAQDLNMQYVDSNDSPLGLAPYVNGFVDAAVNAYAYEDMLVNTVNRYESAVLAGDSDSADMQYWRGKWSLGQADNDYYIQAWHLWNIAWIYEENYDPWLDSYGNTLSGLIRDAAQGYSELADRLSAN
jgi:hypothetical protein